MHYVFYGRCSSPKTSIAAHVTHPPQASKYAYLNEATVAQGLCPRITFRQLSAMRCHRDFDGQGSAFLLCPRGPL